MQSLHQYRRLGRRLREQYVNKDSNDDNLTTLGTTHQGAGTSTPYEGLPLEKQDLEKADDTKSPSIVDGAVVPARPPPWNLPPNGPISSTGATINQNTALAHRFSGVHVRDPLTPGTPESRVYVVGLGNDDTDMNPRNWALWLRIWAT